MNKAELKKLDDESLRKEYERCKRRAINVINDGNYMLLAIDWLKEAVKIEQILSERCVQ